MRGPLMVLALLVACSGGPNQPGGGGRSLSLALADSTRTSFLPGEAVTLVVLGDDPASPFTGTLAGTLVSPVVLDDSRLGFLLPPIEPGMHMLTITNGAARGEIS